MPIDKQVIAVWFFVRDDIDELITEYLLELLFQNNVFFTVVREDKSVIANFTFACQIAENRYKWRDTCTACDKCAFAFVFNGTPWVFDNQRIALLELTNLFGQLLVKFRVYFALKG